MKSESKGIRLQEINIAKKKKKKRMRKVLRGMTTILGHSKEGE